MKSLEKKSTYLFETIRVKNGIIQNEKWHLIRMINSIKEPLKFNLNQILTLKDLKGIYKLKIVYNEFGEILEVRIINYEIPKFRDFHLTNISFSYEKKFLDRGEIDNSKAEFPEIIMVKNGLLTDTSIANIALFSETKNIWITPDKPLLCGTTRARLLNRGFLKPEDISPTALKEAKAFAIMNAMIGFSVVKNPKFWGI